jgi:cobaltochelatase CobN
LAALEGLVTAKGLSDVAALFERREAWADAYRHTPHGKPVQLRADFRISYTYRQSPLRSVTREDGVAKQIRVQDGHLFICNGCCCGRTDKGFPALALDEFKRQWKSRGIRRRFHLTVSGCLGPCPLANVVLLQILGHSMWFHSINHAGDVNLIYDYVEQMLLAGAVLEPPEALMARRFERYL